MLTVTNLTSVNHLLENLPLPDATMVGDIIAEALEASGHDVAVLNGDVPQNQRERTVDRLRKGGINLLVATDVAARGIDVPKVGLVVNYDVPNQDMVYFHRIGRTARAGAKGKAITLVSYSSIADWKIIKKQIKYYLIKIYHSTFIISFLLINIFIILLCL